MTDRKASVRPPRDEADGVGSGKDPQHSEFLSDVQVYEPHRVGLPPLRPYFRELWRRRQFAAHLSSAEMRAAHTQTFFGQVWLVLNPLLMALVYFLLVTILRSTTDGARYLAYLVGALFAFTYVQGAITAGANSVVGSGSLIANMAFPRLLMPLAALRTAFFRFLPTVPVYLLIHLFADMGWTWHLLLSLYFLACMTVFAGGLAAVFATFQVYFRDTKSFLPYLLRMWLYLSPVLWYVHEVPHRFAPFLNFNPMYFMIGGWNEALSGEVPGLRMWIGSAAWAAVAALVGSLYFISREREFAVRL